MQRITAALSEPQDHLATDEAALLLAETGEMGETIRVWEFDSPVVVMGRSTKVDFEINREFCDSQNIPMLRRCSGGASIVGGPGCLMYSVVISLERQGELRKIDAAHSYVMSRVLRAVQRQVPDATLQGTCDLTLEDRKFSGNSLRVSRSHLLYHGTLLYAADLDRLVKCLAGAPRQPDYRAGRSHHDFIINAPLSPDSLADELAGQFGASEEDAIDLPWDEIRRLRRDRYDDPKWHFRH